MNASNSPPALTEFPRSHSRGWTFAAINLQPGQRAPGSSHPHLGRRQIGADRGQGRGQEAAALLGLCPRKSPGMHTARTEVPSAHFITRK